jgi:hypothetical protein
MGEPIMRVVAPVVNQFPNPDFEGATVVQVRCPFCGQTHQHGIGKDEAGSLVHRSGKCFDAYFRQELNRKGLRRNRRHQLEEGQALRERAGGGYFICVPAKVRK